MIKLSVCIPAYNRAAFLAPLLESVLKQDYPGLEIIICEDNSPERLEIRSVVNQIVKKHVLLSKIKYFENEENMGYDKNFRNLLEKSSGEYCLFMGNDDILKEDAIKRILNVLDNYEDIAVISRAYQWFLGEPSNIQDTVRHLPNNQVFDCGIDAIKFFFRRVGVLSGLVFNRAMAMEVSTEIFDGHLYYQMYLAGTLLKKHRGYYIAETQTLSRDGIVPDFGNSKVETSFTPGTYTYMARIHMIEGLLKIARYIDDTENNKIYLAIKRDLAMYFYPYIRDQLNLPIGEYIKFVALYRQMGFNNEKYFYVHCIVGYLLKRKGYDYVIKLVRKKLGHTPKLS